MSETKPQNEIMLKGARLAFPNLFEAKAFNGEGPKKYNAVLLIPKDDPQIKALKKAIQFTGEDKWKDEADKVLKQIFRDKKLCLRDGDEKFEDKGYDGFDGCYFVSASNDSRPLLLDDKANAVVQGDDGAPYAGCYVNAKIRLWAQDNQYGKRINATLQGVMFAKDGEAFAGGPTASVDEFVDLAVEEDSEDSGTALDDLI